MSPRLDKLESLLARVKRHADEPRGKLAGASETEDELSRPPPAMTAELELDEPSLSEPPPARADSRDDVMDLDAEDIDIQEAPPESGAGLVGEAKSIEEAIEKEPHRPPMTPPPESGEEPAPAVSIPKDKGPTMEQLGNTIHLEESEPTDFELDEVTRAASQQQEDKLAADIPQATSRDLENLVLPDNAREELERVRLGQSVRLQPVVTDRPIISTNVVEFVSAARGFQPESFLDLLDASLAL